ncbi:MAG: hypothetical protein RL508_124 [Actinomycetota bacterium]|jgi:hypothetical protein
MRNESKTPFATFLINVADIADLGQIAIGHRRMVPITGGTVSGQIGKGIVLPGTDWQWIHADGTVSLTAHYTLQLDGGDLVEVESTGIRHTDDAGKVYFRTGIRMTAGASRKNINHRLFYSVGTRLPNEVQLDVYALD